MNDLVLVIVILALLTAFVILLGVLLRPYRARRRDAAEDTYEDVRRDLDRVRQERDAERERALSLEARAIKAESSVVTLTHRALTAEQAVRDGTVLVTKIDAMQAEIARQRNLLVKVTTELAELRRANDAGRGA